MEISNLPPVFNKFSIGQSYTSNQTLANQAPPVTQNAPKTEAKKQKKHTFLKIILGAAVLVGLASFLIPFARHKKFPQVNPNLIDVKNNSEKAKKSFISFADQFEVKRDMVVNYTVEKFKNLKELFRKNFFSYNQKTAEEHIKLKEVPKVFVKSILKGVNEVSEFVKELSKKVDIDYTNFTKTL